MKRYYWSGNAVISLFLKDKHSEFFLGLLKKCGTVHTAPCTATEFSVAVAKAANAGRLKPGGRKAMRLAFDNAIQLQRIVLISAGDSTSDQDELGQSDIRKHLPHLDPLTVAHLATAKSNRFHHFVTAEEKTTPLCRIWGLRPVTPETVVKEESLVPCTNRLIRVRDLFSKLENYCNDLSLEREGVAADTESLVKSLKELAPDEKQATLIEEASESFLEDLEEIEKLVVSAELKLSDFEDAAKNGLGKIE